MTDRLKARLIRVAKPETVVEVHVTWGRPGALVGAPEAPFLDIEIREPRQPLVTVRLQLEDAETFHDAVAAHLAQAREQRREDRRGSRAR